MNESIISVRYSKALFNLAKEKGTLEVVKNDMDAVFTLMKESNELQLLFQNPVLKPSKKSEAVDQIFKSFNTSTLSFIKLLIKNRREEHLMDISRYFLDKYMHYKGIENATFTSATTVDKSMLENIKQLIRTLLKTEVELTTSVDERLIGGFILRVGDKQFDASVHSKLNQIKQKLVKATIN
jgi:F-type H+-transporting ATPase subunit delta